jgi:hypothetical protein
MNDLEKLRNPSLAEFEQTHEAVVNGLEFEPKGLKSSKMNDLEMIKAFAELEGVGLYRDNIRQDVLDMIYPMVSQGVTIDEFCDGLKDDAPTFKYNPVTDLALNCAARDKHEIEINYSAFEVICFCSAGLETSHVKFDNKSEIPRAVIECILKSEGKL